MADTDHGMPGTVIRDTNELYVLNGRLVRGANMTVTPEVFEQYRLGYRCLACFHFPQPEAFPERCCEPYCRFPMKRDQLQLLEYEHRGDVDLWPTHADEDDERRERLENDHDMWLPPDF